MQFHILGKVSEFKELEPRTFEPQKGFVIGVFVLGGRFYAYENVCAHEGGPVCEGDVYPNSKFERDKKNGGKKERCTVACPWHGVEYDLETGVCRADSNMRLHPIPIQVKNNDVIVRL
jgi:nitrite reductase (NADH) small subunit